MTPIHKILALLPVHGMTIVDLHSNRLELDKIYIDHIRFDR